MKILLASSEVQPFAKTGGLADVSGALPIALDRLGHETIVFMPAYQQALQSDLPIEETDLTVQTTIGSKIVSGRLLKSQLPSSGVTVYLIDQPTYFDRPGIYQYQGHDFNDNCERFVFFCRAVIESMKALDWYPNIVHCNDWQTSLIPAYLKTLDRDEPGLRDCASLLTIHNLAYQGSFWHWDMLLTGLDWGYFNWQQMECYGRLNLLKTGLVFADALTTVSPQYAKEIQTVEQGCGLQGVLSNRSDRLTGILNGINTEEWNPATDPHLKQNYDVSNWAEGKSACKQTLQQKFKLPETPVPMIGIVGRLASQKGWPMIMSVMKLWLQHQPNIQWVVLGTGDEAIEKQLRRLADKHPQHLGLCLSFSNALAHEIEAAADVFLMPSEYEPCGLNQMYSMRYGTVPVVHATGGLVNSVVPATPETIADQTATGFCFDTYRVESFESTLARAVDTLQSRPSDWAQIVETGMRHDWSWSQSALQYVSLYEQTIRDARQVKSSSGARSSLASMPSPPPTV